MSLTCILLKRAKMSVAVYPAARHHCLQHGLHICTHKLVVGMKICLPADLRGPRLQAPGSANNSKGLISDIYRPWPGGCAAYWWEKYAQQGIGASDDLGAPHAALLHLGMGTCQECKLLAWMYPILPGQES